MEAGLGALIRSARQRRGWTQEQLADKIGVQKSYVSQWETGARKWPQEHIRAISQHLGISQVDMAIAAGLIDAPRDRDADVPEPPVFAEGDPRADILRWLPDINDENAEIVRDVVLAAYNRRRQILMMPDDRRNGSR